VTYAKYVVMGNTVVGQVYLRPTSVGDDGSAFAITLPTSTVAPVNTVVGTGLVYSTYLTSTRVCAATIASSSTVSFWVEGTGRAGGTPSFPLYPGDWVMASFQYEK
jgi:hypothetical protein